MSRIARINQVVAHQPHHIWFRGNNRRKLFSYAHEYRCFLGFFRDAMLKTGVLLHGFSLLSKHGHLLMSPPSTRALSQCMQQTLQRYALYRNRRCRSSGKLFEERFGCKRIDSDSYQTIVHAYIDLNPFRAGIEPMLGEYPWSSAWIHLNQNKERLGWLRELCTPLDWYTNLGTTNIERAMAYRTWLNDCLDSDRFAEMDRKSISLRSGSAQRRASGSRVTT